MRLASVSLRNWKSYRRVRIDVPWQPGRQIAVVEGNNGAGKTSLLEAVILCLYGRAGLPFVARAAAGSRADQSYDGFLERALHFAAKGAAARMTVTLAFEHDGRQIAVERAWHFTGGARHRREDEEIRLYDGAEGDPIPLPEGPEMHATARSFIARELLPENLAGFFVLDGEHLERMAGQTIEAQVRGAAEAVLGAPALRGLADDLRSYARERRRQLPQGADGATARATEELARLEADEREALARVDDILSRLEPLRREREAVVRRIGSLHGESYETFKTLFEERERLIRSRDQQREELRRLLSGDLALALTGRTLRSSALERIAAEDKTDRWQSASASSRGRFDDFLAAFTRLAPAVAKDSDSVLRQAWDEVWSARPESCAPEMRFVHLGEADRRSVGENLRRLSSMRAESVAELSRAVAGEDKRIEEIEREIARQRGLDEEAQGLADELKAIQSSIAALEADHRARVEEVTSLREAISSKKTEVESFLEHATNAAPLIGRARRAEQFADLTERLIEAALPPNLDALSSALTATYKAMAHKSVVDTIRLHPSGLVELLDAQGNDVRRLDASAGEHQVFTLAMMAALASLAPDFPIIVDTPLARLDPLHRRNVLNHFAAGTRQLILLTHPAELGPNEFALIEERLAGTVELTPPAAAAGHI